MNHLLLYSDDPYDFEDKFPDLLQKSDSDFFLKTYRDDPHDFVDENFPRSGTYSDFFLETFPVCFPKAFGQEVFDFVRRFTHPYRHCLDTPQKSPKNEEIVQAIKNKGKKGSHTFDRDGDKFILRPLSPWMFDPKRLGRKFYYTSDRYQALIYFDIDCHFAYQTPEIGQQAKKLIEDRFLTTLGVAPAFLESDRGENGWLKVDVYRQDPEYANRIFDDLQGAIRLLLAINRNLADFEIKGTITHFKKDGSLHGGRYGKMPFSAAGGSYKWFHDLKMSRSVSLNELEKIISEIKAEVSEEDVWRNNHAKHKAFLAHYLPVGKEQRINLIKEFGFSIEHHFVTYQGQQWKKKEGLKEHLIAKIWPGYRMEIGDCGIGVSEKEKNGELNEKNIGDCGLGGKENDVCELKEKNNDVCGFGGGEEKNNGELNEKFIGGCVKENNGDYGFAMNEEPTFDIEAIFGANESKINDKNLSFIYVADLLTEPDSFVRQQKALLRLARSLKRVPTDAEALKFIKENNLYTGAWENPKRKTRIKGILKYIAQTFDANKCRHGSVNVNKYDLWAKKNFPNGLVGGKKKYIDENGEIVEVKQKIQVGTEFIAVFLAICDHSLLQDKNEDSSLPHERAKTLWQNLYSQGLISVNFCNRKWAVCREAMVKYGIIIITDRNYGPDKAMRWDLGQYFPFLGLWKKGSRVKLGIVLRKKRNTRKEQHNTLLLKQYFEIPYYGLLHRSRPPP